MKYIVIGGSSGLGLALANKISKNSRNSIIIYDIKEPLISINNSIYKKIDLSNDDLRFMLHDINESDALIFTAGIGKVKKFDNYTFEEIESTISINLLSLIKILTLAADKLKSNDNYYAMCISSIAGLVSSPLFSVYSASNAGVCKYIEAVNTELIKNNTTNRVTNVVATSFNGTGFNGGKTDLCLLDDLATRLLESMYKKELICKVNEELIDSIIGRYNSDNLKFSLESYDYKINSGRL